MCIQYPLNELICSSIKENVVHIANTKHGCCVVQTAIRESAHMQIRGIVYEVNEHLDEIIVNQYGNYVIQFILNGDVDVDVSDVVEKVARNVIAYSKMRYSASVIEKCFERGKKYIQMQLARRLLEYNENVEELVLDEYGNYVVLKCLLVLDENKCKGVLSIIGGMVEKLKMKSFGNKFIGKLEERYKEFGDGIKRSNACVG